MIETPYYLIDKAKLKANMEKIARLRSLSGVKCLLALKCFATWSVFDFMQQYMDGTTSSSLYEVKLGKEQFGKETHAYSVAYNDNEIEEVISYADKIIFNSASQLQRFKKQSENITRGLRLNPQISISHFDLADPARPFSRLGEPNLAEIEKSLPLISGFMIHNNCENDDFLAFKELLEKVEAKFGHFFHQVEWVSLGGGIHFTAENYPLEQLAELLKDFANRYKVQLYLEPGEAAITNSTSLEVTVLDILNNGKDLAIVDSSVEAHMLDLLIYRESAKMRTSGEYEIMICGKSCLAGDVFGTFNFPDKLKIGDRISISDAGGYTMVKKNWFNGVKMPSIVIQELDGTQRLIRSFNYKDYMQNLS